MKLPKSNIKLGIPVSKLIEAIALFTLCIVLIVVEVKYRGAKPAAHVSDAAGTEVAEVVDYTAAAVAGTEPQNLINEQTVIVDGAAAEGFTMAEPISFDDAGSYFKLTGIPTFRGNNYRNGASIGTANVSEGKLNKIYEKITSALQAPDGNVWTGSGWTGQPLVAQWPYETRQIMTYMYDWARNKETLTEVIYATMDGFVYFFELETGEATRDPLFLGYTFKGAGALDPRGIPILYVGAGYQSMQGDGRVLVVSLVDGSLMYSFGAADGYASRTWSMYDASPLVDAETDQLIYPGENGLLYIVKLNTAYDEAAGTLNMYPNEPIRWRYNGVRTGTAFWVGVEASPVCWSHYLYMADNGGNFMCLDLNNLQLVWVQNVLDDTNCTPVLGDRGRPPVPLHLHLLPRRLAGSGKLHRRDPGLEDRRSQR